MISSLFARWRKTFSGIQMLNIVLCDRVYSDVRTISYLPVGHPSRPAVLRGTSKKADQRLLKTISTNPNRLLAKYLPNLKALVTTFGREPTITYFQARSQRGEGGLSPPPIQ